MGSSTIGVGQDYTTAVAWESAKQADLTGLGDEIANIVGNVTADTQLVSLTGWTTTASDRIVIQGIASGDRVGPRSVLHATSPGTHAAIGDNGIGAVIQVWEDYVKVANLELHVATGQKKSAIESITVTATTNLLELYNCMFNNDAGFSSTSGIAFATNQNLDIYNCIIVSKVGRGLVWSGASATVRYVTMIGGGDRICWDATGTATVYNTVSMGGTAESWRGTFAGGSHNASDLADCTSKFTNSQDSLTMSAQYVNPSEDRTVADWTLLTGADLNGAGLDQGDITEDMFGTTRPDPPAVGALEFYTAPVSAVRGDADGLYRQSAFHDGIISDNGGPWTGCHVNDFRRALCIAAGVADYNSVSVEDAWKRYTEL
jgi:hypothetical protein